MFDAWLLALCSSNMHTAGPSRTIVLEGGVWLTEAVQQPDSVLHASAANGRVHTWQFPHSISQPSHLPRHIHQPVTSLQSTSGLELSVGSTQAGASITPAWGCDQAAPCIVLHGACPWCMFPHSMSECCVCAFS